MLTRILWLAFFVPALCFGQGLSEIRGLVRDARGGEPLAQVEVELLGTAHRTVTDSQGRFAFQGVEPGSYVLHASTVGYRLVTKEFKVSAGAAQEFEIVLAPDTFRQTTSVEVTAGPFDTGRSDSPSELSLRGVEAKNLASVLADDPLRAVQALPGVTSNDDFNSRFSLRGADFHRIGLYLDEVLLHSPFHAVQDEPASGSLTIFNGDMLDSIDLHNGAYPVRFEDSTAGALDLHTRPGSRLQPAFRVSASASNSGVLAEGPLGKRHNGDWLASFRKSYLQYLVKRVSSDPSLAFGFLDGQGRVAYDVSSTQHVSLSVIDGLSGLDRTSERSRLGLNTVMTSSYHFSFANLGWTFAPTDRFLLTNHVAYMREKFDNHNPQAVSLEGGHYSEWVWNASGTWLWNGPNGFDFGWSLRCPRDNGFFNRYQYSPFAFLTLDDFKGDALRAGAYAEQSWRAAHGRVRLSAGLRWDRQSVNRIQAVSPQVSLSLLATESTRINLGWGQYVQEPDLEWFFSRLGSPNLLPERATSFVASLEQRLDQRTRMLVELYDRQDRDLLFRSFYEPRLIVGTIFNPPLDPPLHNALRGYSRGAEIFLQRRSANGMTGWVSYALGDAHLRDPEAGIAFPSDEDQRHTVNAYVGYRLRPTVNISLKALYGSGFPLPGFYRQQNGLYFLSAERNALRIKPYQRTDFRINKAYVFDRWKLTLYGEVINLFNRQNLRFDTFNGYNSATAQAFLTLDKLVPILPSAGVVLEF